MLTVVTGLAAIAIGYLLGSIPGAYIMSRLCRNIDIRDVDTGNVGTASTLRAIGIWQGIIVLFIDVGKGALSVLIAQWLGVSLPWIAATGFAAFMGHNFPVYIGFRGGQGVATLIGIFLVLTFWATGFSLVIIGIILLISWRKILYRIFFAILIGGSLLPIFICVVYSCLKVPVRHDWVGLAIFALVCVVFLIARNWNGVKEPLQATIKRARARFYR